MKKLLIILLFSMTALLATAQNKGSAPKEKPHIEQKAEMAATPNAAVVDSASAQVPIFYLHGTIQDFIILKNAIVSLKFYSKEGSPDSKAVELVEWIDRQIDYQVKLIESRASEPPPGKK